MRKRCLFLLGVILSIGLMTSCSSSKSVEYYCTQRITELVFEGKKHITREEITYDAQWRIVSSTAYDGDEITGSRSYEYREEGKHVDITQVYDGIETHGTFQRTYDKSGNMVKEDAIEDGKVVSSNEYTYDEHGNVLVHIYWPNDSVMITNSYSYDEKGKRIMYENKTQYLGDDMEFVVLTEYGYAETGHLLWENTYVNGTLSACREYVYEEESRTEDGTLLNLDGTVNSRTRRIFDAFGNVLVQEQLTADGTLLTRTIQTWAGTDGSISKWEG